MQSSFGVSEIQQFMVDGSAHPFLTPPPSSSVGRGSHEIYHPSVIAPANKLVGALIHSHPQYAHPTPSPALFPHFHSNIPITQQLFTPPPPHHPHFQLQGDDHMLQGGATPSSFFPADSKFKHSVDHSPGGSSRDGFNSDNDVCETRLRSWHREQDCSIKEPFWRPLDLDYINSNNKRCKLEKEPPEPVFSKRGKAAAAGELETAHASAGGSNYKLFSELEAIYKPGATDRAAGSGSALTGDEHPLAPLAADLDSHLEDNTSLKKSQRHGRRRRRRQRVHLGSIAAFFEGLLKQLIDHQEALHQKFLEAMEQRDRERCGQEEAWREQEMGRLRREAAARAHDRQLAAAREAAILSFLEKITGEAVSLPPCSPKAAAGADFASGAIPTNRWPKAEVQALIQVRTKLDEQFQEPGLKGPLWEEVSAAMAAMGYHRSAKRCKEKWENINKYFRKSRDSGRKRSEHSKTCPYFYQLDQLYAKPVAALPLPEQSNSELLDAVVVAGERQGLAGEEEADDDCARFVEQLE